MAQNDRLKRAKKYLAIAESNDSKREAYMLATNEIAAYKAETGAGNNAIAEALGNGRTNAWVNELLKWKTSGFAKETPFAHGGTSDHRRVSDSSAAKRILREQPVEVIAEMMDDLPDEAVEKIARATEGTRVTRRLYPDRPKPTHAKATERARAKDTEGLKANQWEASARLGSAIGAARAQARVVVRQYEEFLALVTDENYREDGREQLVSLRADIDLALGEVLDGSIEQAFARLLNEEEVK